jgi:hypothetical protein
MIVELCAGMALAEIRGRRKIREDGGKGYWKAASELGPDSVVSRWNHGCSGFARRLRGLRGIPVPDSLGDEWENPAVPAFLENMSHLTQTFAPLRKECKWNDRTLSGCRNRKKESK